MMYRLVLSLVAGAFLFATSSAATAHYAAPAPKTDVNYAFGGASTGTINATALFAPELDAAVGAIGLDLIGLDVGLELAVQTLDRVDSQTDVFWVWAGLNDYLAGGADPTIAPARIVAALETLYDRVNARIFVVPNLFRAGMIPLAQTLPPGADAGLDALTAGHNAALAGGLAAFAATHPDAIVVPVDVYAIFEAFLLDPAFTNVTDSCVDVSLPTGGNCDGWLFFDTVHPTSAAMGYVATAAATALAAVVDGPVRRVITIGDSFSDTGMFFDTIERATGTGFPPAPPFYLGRFADGPNVLDQFETLVGVATETSRFSQPLRAPLDADAHPHLNMAIGELDVSGEVFVRRSIDAGDARFATLHLGATACLYGPQANSGELGLWGCTGGVRLGERVQTTSALLVAWGFTGESISLDLFYY